VTPEDVGLAAGQKVNGYTCSRIQEIPELELTAVHLTHDRTGAEHLHIARDDQNNVFSIGFKTNPPDDTGVPHILEHTTLCGSRKYPVRDPFFKMLNRSLSNFMNAMTASDYTYYPFASTSAVDIANLRDVYLDSTIFPLLRELDFKQEGWRLEHEDPADPGSPVIFKGVVYNEMKGMMSDASYVFYTKFQKQIYPSLNDSGGDPQKITDLTYSQLKSFHAQNYHPSNSRIFTYGNIPLSDHLAHINEKFSAFSKGTRHEESKPIKFLQEDQRIEFEGPQDPMNNKNKQIKSSISFVMNDTTDVFETFCLRVMSSLLLDGHASPMYKALIDTNLGSEWSPNTGYDASAKTGVLSIGLQGVSSDNVGVVEKTIEEVLRKTSIDGFDEKRIEAILHQLELGLKHRSTKFGMSLLSSLSPGWFNQANVFDMLAWNQTITRFRAKLGEGEFLESLIQKYLLGRKPRLIFTMRPAESFSASNTTEEQYRLRDKLQGLESKDYDQIKHDGNLLFKTQEAKEDLSMLPTLHVKDIARQSQTQPLTFTDVDGIPLQRRLGSTNGLTYFRAISPLESLPNELVPYIPLYCDALLNLGTKSKSIGELESEIKRKTGGLSVHQHLVPKHSDFHKFDYGLALSGYALDSNVPYMFDLLSTLIMETDFNNVDKLKSMIRGKAAGVVDSIAESGHAYARNFAASKLTALGRASEISGGLSQAKLISRLAQTDHLDDVVSKLKGIQKYVFNRASMRTALTCRPDSIHAAESSLSKFIGQLPHMKPSTSSAESFVAELPAKSFVPLPFQVNYSGLCLTGVPYTHSDGASIQVLASMLTHKHLHREIREKGGAYGGGASYNATSGIFGFYSYRDPNVERTLNVFKNSGDWVLQNDWSDRDLEDAKLSIFQSIDAPVSISQEGMIHFVDGITDEMRQRRRENLLDVSLSDMKEAAAKYVVQPVSQGKLSVAVLGEQKDWVQKDKDWEIHDLSMNGENSPDGLQAPGEIHATA